MKRAAFAVPLACVAAVCSVTFGAESERPNDMESDPSELRNLATTHPDRVKELKKRWSVWQDEQIRRAKAP
jgi:hypothetical protein